MPPTKPKGGRMMALINYRLKITLNDGRQLTGQMLAFDNHMNLVMAETEEFRTLKRSSKKTKGKAAEGAEDDDDDAVNVPEPEQKRTLGLIILRGETVVSLSVLAPPPVEKTGGPAGVGLVPGPGRGAPAGRGMGLAMPPGGGPGGLPMPPGGIPPPMMAGRPMPYGARPLPPPGMPGMPPPPGMPGMQGLQGLPLRPPQGFPPGFRPPPPGFGMPPQ
ncbi:Sm-like ribonucleo protein [Tilletiaria anomala UBC 951]|uniref:Sm protein B n=1 Tax=Tilletiaria anomala (strain ATCC 24038 / CBS 436.72 / UBC 951) TaxID=1037660 RepID=A0A066W6H8_TILAU|nr:Sm-like ribonucleoprotein [Tilletiaria anomala UBC 951]KDN49582.1 Sm-like ribonucleo protein [Tilletiaria anomala UBC 951]